MDRKDLNRTEAVDVDVPQDAELQARREFLKKAGKAAAAAPALALILRAKSVQAGGHNQYGPTVDPKPRVHDSRKNHSRKNHSRKNHSRKNHSRKNQLRHK